MWAPLRNLALSARRLARRSPGLHRAVNAAARAVAATPPGRRLLREVLAPEQTPRFWAYWCERYDVLSDDDRTAIAAHIGRMAGKPLISVVMPAYATPEPLIRAAIASVKAQLWPHWELCIADDASPGDALWRVLQDEAAKEPRIKLIRRGANGHICAATNSALGLATGEFVALMDHDDLLHERALYEVAAVVEAHPDADVIYSDEDKVDHRGRRFEPYLKTDWNPELVLGQNLVSHLGVYRRSLIDAVGGLREGFEGSQDWDLALRVSERTDRIHHIPWVLYHWRQQARGRTFSERQLAQCADSARRAVQEHLARTGQVAEVTNQARVSAWLDVRQPAPEPRPPVSVIVPTRDRAELLAQCAEGVLAQTRYPDLELLIVDNDSAEPGTHALFERLLADPRVRILPAPGPFNYPALNNQAAAAARGEVLLLLNNDISMPDDGWLDALMAHAVRPNVGAVGARLVYPDGKLQHAGVALGIGSDPGVAGHMGYHAEGDDPGYYGHWRMTRNVSAVTAACLAVRKAVYDEVGGLDPALAVAFNDVDFCLKVRAAGYDIVWTPHAELIHHESASRGSDKEDPVRQARFAAEVAEMRKRWGSTLDNDPFYGPLFDRMRSDYGLAFPPRRVPPWVSSDSRR